MKQYALDLLQEYRDLNWTVCEKVSSANPTLPSSVNAKTPLIIPVNRNIDLSPTHLRSIIGLTPDDRVISIHSGVFGDGLVSEVAGDVAKRFRQNGIVVCNGGFPSKPGLMRNIMEGALSAGEDLPPLVVIVTEDLFRKDNLKGRYPYGPIRILLLEDSEHRPDTMIRAHVLNIIAGAIWSINGGAGTGTEMFHYIEQMGLNPQLYTAPIVITNLSGFYDGLQAQFQTALEHKYMDPLQGAGFYTSDKEANKNLITKDIFDLFLRLLDGVPLQEADRPPLSGGVLQSFAALAALKS
jgi:predicted Rossmann-fold nucleotide-binding protein